MAEDKNVFRHRPPTYANPEDMAEKMQEYFDNPPLKNHTVNGETIQVPFVSITGLALHLGFASRQSMYDYEEKEAFSYIVKRARTLIENEYEFMLQKGNTTGAIFALKQFKWTDKVEQEEKQQDIIINIDTDALGIKKDA